MGAYFVQPDVAEQDVANRRAGKAPSGRQSGAWHRNVHGLCTSAICFVFRVIYRITLFCNTYRFATEMKNGREPGQAQHGWGWQ